MPPVWVGHPDYDHERDFVGYGEAGHNPQWPNGAKIAISFVINYEEVSLVRNLFFIRWLTVIKGGERSVQMGDGIAETNLRENPMSTARPNERSMSGESEYEYGSRAGWWRLFRLFNDHKMKFTLYGVASAVEKNPVVAKRCVEEGHEVASQ